jgi:2'-5' RNA ligase
MREKRENESPEKAEVSGSYGFVIKPDAETQKKAEALAREMAPNAEFQTKIPHITLYHARLDELPLQAARDILLKLRAYKGETLILNSFEVYGGKFFFWDNEKTDILRSMHGEALKLATYLDKKAVARAVEEGLNMTPEELENIKRYGHPLVLERYTPHITLAYDSRGLVLPPHTPATPREMKIDDVLFAEMGKYGSVARVVDLQ